MGCVAVVVFGVLLVLLARCIRRKRFGDLESGFSKMRDSMSFGRKSPPSNAPGLQISSPLTRIPVERNPTDPRWQGSTPQMQQGGVGLAISPLGAWTVVRPPPPTFANPRASPPVPVRPPVPNPIPAPALASASPPAQAQRNVPQVVVSPATSTGTPRAGRSPPKPSLTLAIPKRPERPIPVPSDTRDSVVTEFAEDGETDTAPRATVWRPPPTDPQSATTYYFADKGGNWILRNTSTRRTESEASRKASTYTGTTIQEAPSDPVEVELPSPEQKTRAERAKDPYGGFSPDAVVSPLRLPRKPGQGKLGSPIAFKDQRRDPKHASPDPDRRFSQTSGSATSGSVLERNRPPDAYLAMAREARDLTGGKGKQRSVRRASRRVSQDSVTSIESAATPFEGEDAADDLSPVAESPQTPVSPGKSPATYPRIRQHNADQRAAAPRSAPPEADLLPPAHRFNEWHPPGHSSPTGTSVPARTKGSKRPWNAPNLSPGPSREAGRARTGSPEARTAQVSPIEEEYWRQQRQVANPASYWNQAPRQVPPARARPPPQSQTQPAPTAASNGGGGGSAAAAGPGQSSLLAKRRGADKAAALTLGNGADGALQRGGEGGGPGGGKSGWIKEEPHGPVPITPGWVPELTPTRRGDDLYLDVR